MTKPEQDPGEIAAAEMEKAKAAEPDKVAPALDEVDDEAKEKTVEYEGLTLTLPAELPSAVLFNLISAEAASEGIGDYLGYLRILQSIVGEDQFVTIGHRFGNDPERVTALVTEVLEAFGMTMGESEASPES